ncbi:MAG TPA: Rrf2 family transcriptional regulator [Persephonella sp.]|nr:Rrf2 family transcriptional regulator [Hydrogenothermaceae bacterium]HIQ25449.1 Rrf2 family transcriptional regulator [Persephonella sp.]
MLSTACKDAIRAMIYIAKNNKGDFISISEIAKELNLSFYFLSKILQKLVKGELLKSYRGPNGGVKLAKSAENIRLIDIIEIIDGTKFFSECILGLEKCSDDNPCPIHYMWADKREEIQKMFDNTTLKDIVEDINKLHYIKL